LSSDLGRSRHRSVLASSYGHSDNLPLFRMLDGLPSDRCGSCVGMFTDLSRYYTVQPVTETKTDRKQLVHKSSEFSQPDVKPGDLATNDNGQTHDHNSVCTTSSPRHQHSERDVGIQLTSVNSDEEVSRSETLKKVGLMQRFRMMYKQYGAVLIGVHVVTSSVWFSLFYCATVRYYD